MDVLPLIWGATLAGAVLFFLCGFVVSRAAGRRVETDDKTAARIHQFKRKAEEADTLLKEALQRHEELERRHGELTEEHEQLVTQHKAEAATGHEPRPRRDSETLKELMELEEVLQHEQRRRRDTELELSGVRKGEEEKTGQLLATSADLRKVKRQVKDLTGQLQRVKSVAVEYRAKHRVAETERNEFAQELQTLQGILGVSGDSPRKQTPERHGGPSRHRTKKRR